MQIQRTIIVQKKKIEIQSVIIYQYIKRHNKFHGIEGVWHPPDQRNIDLSHLKFKYPSQMNKKDFSVYNEILEMQKNAIDIGTDHPFIKEVNEKIEKERAILEPER